MASLSYTSLSAKESVSGRVRDIKPARLPWFILRGWNSKQRNTLCTLWLAVCRRAAGYGGSKINCFELIFPQSRFFHATTSESINSDFILKQLDAFSFSITKPTVLVLDNAQPHTAGKVKQWLEVWQKRGLHIFYLPPYSPHLNIAETLWRKLKYEWLKSEDYLTTDGLFYAVNRAFAAVEDSLQTNSSPFNYDLN